jgi:Ca-activated chloride channel family protein
VNFAAPDRLWLLLLVPVLLGVYIYLQYRRSIYAIRFTNIALIDRIAPRRPSWGRHLAVGLALLTMAMVVVAFAKPVGPTKVPLQRATVIVTIDTSLSMGADDVVPNRLVAAQKAASDFVAQLPAQFNVALIAYAKTANVIVPPTTDRQAFQRGLDTLELGPYTATGDALLVALKAVALAPADPNHPDTRAPARIVLISDGKQTFGSSPFQAARKARAEHVPIYSIAVGTEHAVITTQGQQVPVPVSQGQLRRISEVSGGKGFVAASPGALRAIYDDLKSSFIYTTEDREITARFVGYALALVLATSIAVVLFTSRFSS